MMLTLERAGAVRAARRIVAECCSQACMDEHGADAAELLTSEIVTNALLHGRGKVRLGVHVGPTCFRVEVGDDDPRHPKAPAADHDAEGGRGMLIVAALASAWGVSDNPDGKTVWFEIAADP